MQTISHRHGMVGKNQCFRLTTLEEIWRLSQEALHQSNGREADCSRCCWTASCHSQPCQPRSIRCSCSSGKCLPRALTYTFALLRRRRSPQAARMLTWSRKRTSSGDTACATAAWHSGTALGQTKPAHSLWGPSAPAALLKRCCPAVRHSLY